MSHHNYPDIEGWSTEGKLDWLRKRVRETEPLGGPVLEIGVFCGKSTAVLTENEAQVVCVDNFQGADPNFPERNTIGDFYWNMGRLGRDNFTLYAMRSEEFFAIDRQEAFRFIFVDGGHDYKTARADIVSAWSVLKWGGWLVVDDVLPSDPNDVLKALTDTGLPWAQCPDLAMAEVQKV